MKLTEKQSKYSNQEIAGLYERFLQLIALPLLERNNDEIRKLLYVFNDIIANYSFDYGYSTPTQSNEVVEKIIKTMREYGIEKQDDIKQLTNPSSINCYAYAELNLYHGLDELNLFEEQCYDTIRLTDITKVYFNTAFMENLQSKKILNKLSKPNIGCIAEYRKKYGKLTHCALVIEINTSGEVICVSRWGAGSDAPIFKHKLRDVPFSYGNNITFRQRLPVDILIKTFQLTN